MSDKPVEKTSRKSKAVGPMPQLQPEASFLTGVDPIALRPDSSRQPLSDSLRSRLATSRGRTREARKVSPVCSLIARLFRELTLRASSATPPA